MGGSQSTQTSESIPPASKDPTTKIEFHNDDKELSGMALVNYKCRRKHKAYQKCVSNWYNSEFLTGKSISQEEKCGDIFEVYRECVLKGIKKEIWDKKGLSPPKEGSLLSEIMDDDDEKQ